MNNKNPFLNIEYPGRIVGIGNFENYIIATYCVTARSESSRAKRYIYDLIKNLIYVVSTDINVMSKGNMDLLQYNCSYFYNNTIIIGNGKQTDSITDFSSNNASSILDINLKNAEYEPDDYSTPRITGCIREKNNHYNGALNIIRANQDKTSLKKTYNVPLDNNSNELSILCTYAGPNIRPTPPFISNPITYKLDFKNRSKDQSIASIISKDLYNSLKPQLDKPDLRVSVIVISINKDSKKIDIEIINKVDEIN